MKKTLLVTLEFPPFYGGIARYLDKLVSLLPENLISVLVPPISGDTDFDKSKKYKISRHNLISRFPLVWPRWIFSYWLVKKKVRNEKIDHLLISHVLPLGTVAWLIKNSLKIPYTVICYGMDVLTAQKSWRKKKTMLMVLNHAQTVIAISQFTASLLKKLGVDQEKIVEITPATDITDKAISLNNEELKQRWQLTDKKVILSVGRLVRRKGYDKVILSLTKVVEKIPEVVYLIVGEGPDQDYLLNLVNSLKLDNKVFFAGTVGDNDLPRYYQSADVFINVERQINEDVPGFGIVFLEANALAKPVIGGRTGGANEAVLDGETGLLVDPNNETEIANSLILLLKNQDLANRMGEAGKTRVQQQFNWSTRYEQLMRILK